MSQLSTKHEYSDPRTGAKLLTSAPWGMGKITLTIVSRKGETQSIEISRDMLREISR